MRVLVLGGYGLIGLAVVRALIGSGVNVVGAGRNPQLGRSTEPRADWTRLDLASAESITQLDLSGIDAVVNAAGALQDGADDNLVAVHHTGIDALLRRCEAAGVTRFVQISAAGVSPDASTDFFRTKAAGDAAVRAASLEWAILKPGLVLGQESYGGSTLLRALAAIPIVQPVTFPDTEVHLVALTDVAEHTVRFAKGEFASGTEVDLVSDGPIRFRDLVTGTRAALGWPSARVIALPDYFAHAMGWIGDVAARFGWRTPLRSTSMTVMSEGISGDPDGLRDLTGAGIGSAQSVLGRLQLGAGDRSYASLFWVRPALLLTLAAFWITTGIIALVSREAAMPTLTEAGLPAVIASLIVVGGAFVDIALGLGALIRRTARPALWGMMIVTAGYLAGATVFVPELWLDPLGPLVKPVPTAVMAGVMLALLERR